MKKLLVISAIAFSVACSSNETNETATSEGVDSFANSNTEKNINDSPLRTRDTTTNIMKDTMKPGDSVPTPR